MKQIFPLLTPFLLFPTEAPTNPGKPKVLDTDEDAVTLGWEPPSDDGGNPIQGYVVEMKEPGSDRWKPAHIGLARDNKLRGKKNNP